MPLISLPIKLVQVKNWPTPQSYSVIKQSSLQRLKKVWNINTKYFLYDSLRRGYHFHLVKYKPFILFFFRRYLIQWIPNKYLHARKWLETLLHFYHETKKKFRFFFISHEKSSCLNVITCVPHSSQEIANKEEKKSIQHPLFRSST